MPYYEAALQRHKEVCVCHIVHFLTSRQPEQYVVSMLKDTLRLADAQKSVTPKKPTPSTQQTSTQPLKHMHQKENHKGYNCNTLRLQAIYTITSIVPFKMCPLQLC